MEKYLSLSVHFIASLISYLILSIQRYTIDYPMTGAVVASLIISLIITIRYLLKYRESMIRLIAVFAVFIYVAAAERAFILLRTLSATEIYVGLMVLALLTLNIAILLYFVLRGEEGKKIVKLDYKGYA